MWRFLKKKDFRILPKSWSRAVITTKLRCIENSKIVRFFNIDIAKMI